ncbi:hypothetical protein GWK47_040132 [Chionoecetes opilio]|uniref:Uncharacterized protein n=1 Tax=Chionoecetes opilio TaxID=41210 RepID=A0A8J4YC97_CHIOP|nr:hypothetical protein GWK47_040132 [Chionoecetes opilio]
MRAWGPPTPPGPGRLSGPRAVAHGSVPPPWFRAVAHARCGHRYTTPATAFTPAVAPGHGPRGPHARQDSCSLSRQLVGGVGGGQGTAKASHRHTHSGHLRPQTFGSPQAWPLASPHNPLKFPNLGQAAVGPCAALPWPWLHQGPGRPVVHHTLHKTRLPVCSVTQDQYWTGYWLGQTTPRPHLSSATPVFAADLTEGPGNSQSTPTSPPINYHCNPPPQPLPHYNPLTPPYTHHYLTTPPHTTTTTSPHHHHHHSPSDNLEEPEPSNSPLGPTAPDELSQGKYTLLILLSRHPNTHSLPQPSPTPPGLNPQPLSYILPASTLNLSLIRLNPQPLSYLPQPTTSLLSLTRLNPQPLSYLLPVSTLNLSSIT